MGNGASEPKKNVNEYSKRISSFLARRYTGDLFNQSIFDKHVVEDKRWLVGLIAGIQEKIEETQQSIDELKEEAVTTKRKEEIAALEEEKEKLEHDKKKQEAKLAAHDGCIPVKKFLQELVQGEHKVLVEMFNCLGGKKWKRKARWLQKQQFGFWDGVLYEDNIVIGLELHNNNLVGTLPESVSRLRSLRSVRLEDNPQLDGNIPLNFMRAAARGQRVSLQEKMLLPRSLEPISSDKSLTSLDLAGRGAIGHVEMFRVLVGLKKLVLRGNNLVGTVSRDLYNIIVQCEQVDFSFNPELDQSNLYGFLPSNYTRLYDLAVIDGEECGITGPMDALEPLKDLVELNLSGNVLTGPIDCLANHEHLEVVQLNNNYLQGVIPMNLIWLKLDGYQVDLFGNKAFSLPPEIDQLPDPCQIDLSRCSLKCELPLSLLRLKVRWWCRVSLEGNLGLSLPKDMSPLVREATLYGGNKLLLARCSLVGDLTPLHVFAGSEDQEPLEVLELQDNLYTGIVPELAFKALCNIKRFDLSRNRLDSTTIGSYLATTNHSLWNRRRFDLRDLRLSGPFPAELIRLAVDEGAECLVSGNKGFTLPDDLGPVLTGLVDTIALNNFLLEGSLEPLAGLADDLKFVSLNDNEFLGDLSAVSDLGLLEELQIARNRISGSLTPLAHVRFLRVLNLDNNGIEGSLSPLMDLGHLEEIRLCHNKLTGTLNPLANLKMLRVLSVAQNGLEGDLLGLKDLCECEHIELWNNHLTGDVETYFTNKPKLSFLWLNNHEQYPQGEWNNLDVKKRTQRLIHKKVPDCFIHL